MARVEVAELLSEARALKANRPQDAQYCRKKPLTLLPSMLANVWKLFVEFNLTQAATA
jgi:hypothetical protein